MRLAVLLVTAFLLSFLLYGCATEGWDRRIIPDKVTWIEKQRTTRAEVVVRFGPPPVEFPLSLDFTGTSTTTTRTDSVATTQIQRPTRKATYVYIHRDAAVFPYYDNLQSTQCQFWVVYDDKGVVQDFGFLGEACDGQLQDRGLHLAAQ